MYRWSLRPPGRRWRRPLSACRCCCHCGRRQPHGSAEAPRLRSLEEEEAHAATAATTATAARRRRSRRQKVSSFAAAPPAIEGVRSLESMRRQRLRAPATTAMEEDPPPPGANAEPKKQRPERRRDEPHDELAPPALQQHQLHQALSRPVARRPPAAQLETEAPLATRHLAVLPSSGPPAPPSAAPPRNGVSEHHSNALTFCISKCGRRDGLTIDAPGLNVS